MVTSVSPFIAHASLLCQAEESLPYLEAPLQVLGPPLHVSLNSLLLTLVHGVRWGSLVFFNEDSQTSDQH